MVDDPELMRLTAAAREWLDAARAELEVGRRRVAFEAARHAAELACKAILLRENGSYPKTHDVAGLLAQQGLVPEGLSPRQLSRLLSAFTAGTYGFEREIREDEVQLAIGVARMCVIPKAR